MSYKTYSWWQLHTHLLVQVCIVVVHWHQKSHMLKWNDRLLCWWFWIVLNHQQSSFSDWIITGNKPLLELIRTLVCENVFCSVSQLVQIWQTGVLDHWWRTAQDNKDVSGRSREVVLDHLRGYEPWTVAPILRKRKRERKKDQLSTSRNVFRQFTCQYCFCFVFIAEKQWFGIFTATNVKGLPSCHCAGIMCVWKRLNTSCLYF